jgi:segregation and condensation protein A
VQAQANYQIALPIFEGPMDLLLHLIRESKLDIYDIPIADITRQYLDAIELMRELNLEVAGEFLVMAATLIQIKSRMLLPPDEDANKAEDPRAELVERILEFQKFKESTSELREREDLWRQIFSAPPRKDDREIIVEVETRSDDDVFDFSVFDLLTAFRRLLESAPAELVEITRETLTVKDRINHIVEMLEDAQSVRFESAFSGARTRRELIVTFLALLEVLRLGLARVYQERHFSSIWLLAPKADS